MPNKKTAKNKLDDKKLSVCDLKGKEKDSINRPGFLLTKISDELLGQAVMVERDRARIRRAQTKGRAQVRGGGAKPWRQKGTGRARHGSRRSPLWVGGGITFGPHAAKRVGKFMPRGQKSRALAGVLSRQADAGSLRIIELEAKAAKKTKELAQQINVMSGVLLVITAKEKEIVRAARNIRGLLVREAEQLTTTDVIGARQVWLTREAMEQIGERISGIEKSGNDKKKGQ